jgi:hypothetical protein
MHFPRILHDIGLRPPLFSFCRKTLFSKRPGPKSRQRVAAGVSPSSEWCRAGSPERAAQKSIGTMACAAPSGLNLALRNNPGLTPAATLCRPFGPGLFEDRLPQQNLARKDLNDPLPQYGLAAVGDRVGQ